MSWVWHKLDPIENLTLPWTYSMTKHFVVYLWFMYYPKVQISFACMSVRCCFSCRHGDGRKSLKHYCLIYKVLWTKNLSGEMLCNGRKSFLIRGGATDTWNEFSQNWIELFKWLGNMKKELLKCTIQENAIHGKLFHFSCR